MGTVERDFEQNMNVFIKRMNTRNDKVVEIIEDRIRDVETYKGEYSKDYFEGYISGLKYAKTIAKEILY